LKKNKKSILYFYPKDNTSWCTIEAIDFSQIKKVLDKNWIWIFWVSKDSDKSHCNFIDKHNLTIDLISDTDLELQKKFGVLWEKSMFGKKYLWTIRSTFLLDEKWKILKERRGVSAKWHVEEVLKSLNI
jgi:peroxiredoxin Q/BCP